MEKSWSISCLLFNSARKIDEMVKWHFSKIRKKEWFYSTNKWREILGISIYFVLGCIFWVLGPIFVCCKKVAGGCTSNGTPWHRSEKAENLSLSPEHRGSKLEHIQNTFYIFVVFLCENSPTCPEQSPLLRLFPINSPCQISLKTLLQCPLHYMLFISPFRFGWVYV